MKTGNLSARDARDRPLRTEVSGGGDIVIEVTAVAHGRQKRINHSAQLQADVCTVSTSTVA